MKDLEEYESFYKHVKPIIFEYSSPKEDVCDEQ